MAQVKKRKSIRFKYTLALIVFGLSILITSSLVGYSEFKTKFEDQYIEQAYTISRLISSNIDPKNLQTYLNEDRYTILDILKGSLDSMWKDMDINYILLTDTSFQTYNYLYIKQGSLPNRTSMREDWILRSDFDQQYYIAKQGKYHLDVILPIHNEQGHIGALVRTQINLDHMYRELFSASVKIISGSLLIAGLFMTLFLRYIREFVLQPIVTISKAADEFANSHYERMPNLKPLNTEDEIDYLVQSICKMTKDIKDYIANIEENINEKEKMNADLRIAHHIQRSLLPKEFPRTKEYDIYAFMNSADKVGGDFYDFFEVGPNQLAIVIGDVSGKGIPAALFMTTVKEWIKTKTIDGNQPNKVFEIVNNALIGNSADRMFVTSWLGKIDLENGILTYVSAGHPPAMIKRKGQDFQPLLENQNKLLVAFEDVRYRQSTFQLEEGDIIFLYTDGVTEAEKNDILFGEGRLKEALDRNIKIYEDMEDFVKSIRYEIRLYEKESTSKDDLTMLAFQFKGKRENPLDHIM